jgi:nitroreductase
MLYEVLGIERGDHAARQAWFSNNFRFFDAPVGLMLVTDERMGHGQWGHAGMYLQTLALLAEERGWGTCFQECWGMLRPALKEHFRLGPTEMIWCGVAVGKPDKSHPVNTLRAERAEFNDVVELHGF